MVFLRVTLVMVFLVFCVPRRFQAFGAFSVTLVMDDHPDFTRDLLCIVLLSPMYCPTFYM